jgi:hypothetical protein
VEAGGGKLGLVSQQVAGLVNRGGGNGAGTFQAGLSQEFLYCLRPYFKSGSECMKTKKVN